MYGKFFASTYTGSMFGSGTDVFAVWGYVVANTVKGQVELNPRLLAAALGTTADKITKAIESLCAPDPGSRSKVEDGRRLIREGEYAYRVPTYFHYLRIRDEEERREYNRAKKQEQRDREKKSTSVKVSVKRSIAQSNMSAHKDKEVYKTKTLSGKGGDNTNHCGANGKSKPSPPPSQTDFDQRDQRRLADARKKIDQRCAAAVGTQITDADYWTAVCEESGLTAPRVKELLPALKWTT